MTDQKNGLSALFGGHLRENGMLMALMAIVVFFALVVQITQGVDFLSAQNITNIFLQNSYVIIMALGMLLVIVSGHIDLSVGSVVGFVGAVAAVLTVKLGWPVYGVVPACLGAGLLIGAAQGYWIAYWRIPSFIVTLAGMLVFRVLSGLAQCGDHSDRADAALYLFHGKHDDRAAHLCHGRQRKGGKAVEHQNRPAGVPDLLQHGRSGGTGGNDRGGPAQLCHPQGGGRV